MIKQKKALLIAGGLMLAGWTFVGYEQQSVAQNNGKIHEYVKEVYKLNDIIRVEYANDELTTLVNTNGVWYNNAFPYLNYDQSLVNEWIALLQNLETNEVIKNVQNMSLYGIDEHAPTITFYDSDNQKQTLKLGRHNESENRLYIESDGNNLYTVSYDVNKKLLTRPNDFINCDLLLNISDLQKIHMIFNEEKPLELVKAEAWHLDNYFAFDTVLQESASKELVNTIENMKVKRYIGTYEDLKPYGLEKPKMTLILNDTTKIDFGNQMGQDIYVRLNDSHDVYVMNNYSFKELKNFKPAKSIEKQVIHTHIDEIEQIILSNPQGTYEINFIEPTSTDELTNPIETIENIEEIEEVMPLAAHTMVIEEPIIATINDRELTPAMVAECLDAIQSSLYIEAPLINPSIEQKQDRKSEANFTFKLKDQSTIQIELIPYDINYYILRYNGTTEFAVNKEKVTSFFKQFNETLKK